MNIGTILNKEVDVVKLIDEKAVPPKVVISVLEFALFVYDHKTEIRRQLLSPIVFAGIVTDPKVVSVVVPVSEAAVPE